MTSKNILRIGLGIIVLAIIGIGVFFFATRGHKDTQAAAAADSAAAIALNNPDEPIVPTVAETQPASEGLRSYENRAFHFRLLFPESLSANEYKEAGGALSVAFQEGATGGKGFQIYVTPYGESQITKERFGLDESSGVMQEPTDIVIDGSPATMFFSKNGIMGDTREVWFIHGGFLYEVVTYKELDSWLGSIMQTWKFL